MPVRLIPPEHIRRCQRHAGLNITNRSRASRCYSTDKSVVRKVRFQPYTPYPSMGFVPLQGSQHADASISLTDEPLTLRLRPTVRTLDDILDHPPSVQEHPFGASALHSESVTSRRFEPFSSAGRITSPSRRALKSIRPAVLRRGFLPPAAHKPKLVAPC